MPPFASIANQEHDSKYPIRSQANKIALLSLHALIRSCSLHARLHVIKHLCCLFQLHASTHNRLITLLFCQCRIHSSFPPIAGYYHPSSLPRPCQARRRSMIAVAGCFFRFKKQSSTIYPWQRSRQLGTSSLMLATGSAAHYASQSLIRARPNARPTCQISEDTTRPTYRR